MHSASEVEEVHRRRAYSFSVLVGFTLAAFCLQASRHQAFQEPLQGLSAYPVGSNRSLSQYDSTTPFVFIHIHKAAGHTVTENLKTALRRRCQEVMFKNKRGLVNVTQKGAEFHKIVSMYNERGAELSVAADRAVHQQNTSCFFGHTVYGPRFNARSMMVDSTVNLQARYRNILGHLPFGYCSFAEKGCVYVTVMREPVSRLMSHFWYFQRAHPDILLSECKGGCRDFKSFVKQLADGRLPGMAWMENWQTRMIHGESFWAGAMSGKPCLSGVHACDTVQHTVTRQHLEVAVHNLYRYVAVVGVSEQLPKFAKAMHYAFSLEIEHMGSTGSGSTGPMNYERTHLMNANPEPSLSDPASLDQETMELVEKILVYDIELYSHAVMLVEKQEVEINIGIPLRAPALQAGSGQDELDLEVTTRLNAKEMHDERPVGQENCTQPSHSSIELSKVENRLAAMDNLHYWEKKDLGQWRWDEAFGWQDQSRERWASSQM